MAEWWPPEKALVSQILGYTSIACWLGAQFPQVFQNIKNQNCEGLALVFLLSWAAGDLTNLIGCYLTDQLQFQKYLAIYFVLVDSTLLFQYAYYSRLHRPSNTGFVASSSSLHANSPLASPRVSSRPPHKRHPTRSHNSYDELSHAASAVARAAEALASSRGRRSRSRPKAGQRKLSVKSMEEEGADETENLMASVNSLASDATGSSSKAGRRKSTHQLKESLSSSQLASSKSSTGGPPSPSDVRGRPLSRPTTSIHPPQPTGAAVPRSPETNRSTTTGGRSTERRSVSRKRTKSGTLAGGRGKEATAGLVLLSLVAVVGLQGMSGRETSSGVGTVSPDPTEGRVLVSSGVSSASSLDEVVPLLHPTSPLTHPIRMSSTTNANSTHPDRPTRPPHHPSTPPPTWQRAIGRVSAWTCTVLYLTSRMPQIWKNFTRKSVEGLAILLFVAAFCGNSFYVASILTNPLMDQPRPKSTEYILESLPYLLGSGGTLCFDVCIVVQSLIYGSAPPLPEAGQPWQPLPAHSHHHHHQHVSRRTRRGFLAGGGGGEVDLEAAPLLSDESEQQQRVGMSPKRTRSTSTGGVRGPSIVGRSASRVRININGSSGEDLLGLKFGEAGDQGGEGGPQGVEGLPFVAGGGEGRMRTSSVVGRIDEAGESGIVLGS